MHRAHVGQQGQVHLANHGHRNVGVDGGQGSYPELSLTKPSH